MKINTENWERLNSILDEINGRADTHTFTGPQLKKLGIRIKNHLSRWFTQAEMRGITGRSQSGEKLSSGYKHSRVVNVVHWEVGSGGNVFITAIEKTDAGNEKGLTILKFSPEQEQIIKHEAFLDAIEI